MKQILHLTVLCAFTFLCQAQGRLVINNDSYVIISNDAKIVLENPNSNAVTVLGSGANIVSEGMNNQLVWSIGSSTGNYTIPWTTRPTAQGGNSTKIPFAMNISAAGSTGGQFVLSTYETSTDLNTPYPSGVVSLESPALGMADASLYVIDRFWVNDNSSYTTKPAATISFVYDDAANELGGTNTALEANLLAQRWNPTGTGSWELLQFGSTNTTTNTVSGINVTSSNFWPIWTLVDLNFPLPVILSQQAVLNASCSNTLRWTTSSEINNDYFTINRSKDGIQWSEVARVDGAGNSSITLNYAFEDHVILNEPTSLFYYKIGQVDFNGEIKYFPIMSVTMDCLNIYEPMVYPNPFTNVLYIEHIESGKALLYDGAGRLVQHKNIDSVNNSFELESLAAGLYQLVIESNHEIFPFKIIKQ